jgi:hypothetical protein
MQWARGDIAAIVMAMAMAMVVLISWHNLFFSRVPSVAMCCQLLGNIAK